MLRHTAAVRELHVARRNRTGDAHHVDVGARAPVAVAVAACVVDAHFSEREVATEAHHDGVEVEARHGACRGRIKRTRDRGSEGAGVLDHRTRRNLAHSSDVDDDGGTRERRDGERSKNASDGSVAMHVSRCPFDVRASASAGATVLRVAGVRLTLEECIALRQFQAT